MSLKIYKVEDYSYTHENEQFRALCEVLKKKFVSVDGHYLLFANINFNGVPLDALFIKNNAIVVLEFKNYGGQVTAYENGDWTLQDGTIVKGGLGKNPFQQTKNNRWNTIKTLDLWYPKAYANIYHTSGIVVFRQNMEVDDTHISANVKSWFHITDMRAIANKLEDIVSTGINYTNADLDYLPTLFNCQNKLVDETPQADEAPAQPVAAVCTPEPVAPTPTNDLFAVTEEVLTMSGFTINHKRVMPAREAMFHDGDLSDLSAQTRDYVNRNYHGKLFEHQYEAVKKAQEGNNVCLSTSTSSGKTAVFHMCALEIIARDPSAKILAVYPMKALGRQQRDSWERLGENIQCGRIDGNVDRDERIRIMRECQVVTMTPDTVHTFLLGKLKDNHCAAAIKEFLKGLKLIVLDELHLYKGMLGSNSAYLFRRLNSCMTLLKAQVPQYITASATIADPQQHSKDIAGTPDDFVMIDRDASPSCETKVFITNSGDIDHLPNLLRELSVRLPKSKSITFFDSRKKVEDAIMSIEGIIRNTDGDGGFYPFKANQESEDAERIYNAMAQGNFRGIVSTSSLEVGIDIQGLNIAILYGIPTSSTSLYQRVGRVGRCGSDKAVVIIVNEENNVNSLLVSRDPAKLHSLPYEEPALYLDNENLINIQALHFVGAGGDEFTSIGGTQQRYGSIEHFFPAAFNAVCRDVLNDQLSQLYSEKEGYAAGYSQYAYPIRVSSSLL